MRGVGVGVVGLAWLGKEERRECVGLEERVGERGGSVSGVGRERGRERRP